MLIGPGGQSSTLEHTVLRYKQYNSSPIATSPLYTKKYKVNSHPHGEGWGETWGKFAVPMVGGGGNMGEVHPRGKVHSKSPPMPHPALGGGGGGEHIIDRCITLKDPTVNLLDLLVHGYAFLSLITAQVWLFAIKWAR